LQHVQVMGGKVFSIRPIPMTHIVPSPTPSPSMPEAGHM
jgi:hypothetical protein